MHEIKRFFIVRSKMYDQELQPVAKKFVTINSNGASRNGSMDRDRADLIRLGKKPVLKVGFASIANLSISADALDQ